MTFKAFTLVRFIYCCTETQSSMIQDEVDSPRMKRQDVQRRRARPVVRPELGSDRGPGSNRGQTRATSQSLGFGTKTAIKTQMDDNKKNIYYEISAVK